MALCAQLAALGRELKQDEYHFHAPSPATHARVLARPHPGPDILHDIFGWNRPFADAHAPARYRGFLSDPELFARQPDGLLRARIRFSRLGPLLLAHSGYPTQDADAVFFGPDTYRFAAAIRALADREPDFAPLTCVDVGAGGGAGGLYCAGLFPGLQTTALLDVNRHALGFADANAALNGIDARLCESDVLAQWQESADLIVSNPPYLVDAAARAYRDGGGAWGAALPVRILEQALERLSPVGHLLLYTGTAIVGGRDKFLEEAAPILRQRTVRYRYDETDPDVFGEELEKPPYDQADRIATVVLHVRGSDIKR